MINYNYTTSPTKGYKKAIYLLPWLIILVFCIIVLVTLDIFFDSEKMSRIWWTVSVGGVMGAIVCNLFEIFISRIS